MSIHYFFLVIFLLLMLVLSQLFLLAVISLPLWFLYSFELLYRCIDNGMNAGGCSSSYFLLSLLSFLFFYIFLASNSVRTCHVCTLNKSAHTKKSGNLSYDPRIFLNPYSVKPLFEICNLIYYLPTPPLGQDMTQGQFFKRSLTGLNSEFSFS